MSHMVWRLRGSRPVVGSSRKITRGVADERHREVEPTLHPAGVGGERLARSVDEVELLEQLGHPAPSTASRRGGAAGPSAGGSPRR